VRRQPGIGWHQPHRLLARQPPAAFDVPAAREHLVVFADQLGRRLVRRVAGAWRQPQQPGRFRRVGLQVGQVADRLVDQVGGEVIAGLEGARRIDGGVVADQFGRVLVRLGIHEPVEAVEAPAQRPAVDRDPTALNRSAA
jgi:hypothetical protein